MELIIIEQDERQKVEQVKEGNNYLNFITFHDGRWFASSGCINNVYFLSPNGISWVKRGKGKMSQITINKLQEMNNYFRGK